MSLLATYRAFVAALASGQFDELPTYVDPDAYTESCVGLTGWTIGLDVALANYQFGIAAAFIDRGREELELIEGDDALVIRSRNFGTHVQPFLGVQATGHHVVYDSVDIYRAGPDGRINWRFLLCDWNGVCRQLIGEPTTSEVPLRYALQAPAGHPLAGPSA
jgi:hypothetical protein